MTGSVVVFRSAGEACLESFEVPSLKAGEVLIKSAYSVISAGTELANLIQLPNTGTGERGFPHYPGYCGSGQIAEIGEGVEALAVGDRVIVSWGGHRSHTVKKADQVLKIYDESIDLLDASFAHIASFSFLGVRRLRLEIGEAVMIAGQGILGVFALQIAVLSGAIPVVVTDFDPERRRLALELGATAAFSPDEADLVQKVKEICDGKGPSAVVEVSGSAAALQQALACIAREGRISLLGCTRVSDAPIDYYKHVHRRGISIVGTHTMTRPRHESSPGGWTERDDYKTFLKLIAAGKLQTRPLISEIISPRDAAEVYGRLAREKYPRVGIVFDWRDIV